MVETPREPMLLIASEAALPRSARIWGTGGWRSPEEREALDWLTLSRLLGWGVTVSRRTRAGLDADGSAGSRWVVIAGESDSLGEELVDLLASRLASEPLLVVARAQERSDAGGRRGAFARLSGAARRPEEVSGRFLRWTGPGPARLWTCRSAIDAGALELSEGAEPWATLDGAALIAARRVGRGVVATLGFHPSQARDQDGAATALLRQLLIWGAGAPVAWLDLEGSLVLRMDDPGGAQNVYLRSWSYPKLGEAEWAAICADLRRRNGRISLGYVAGWVDDGDAARGELEVAGCVPQRVPGQVYPSPLVRYQDRAGHAPGTVHDYQSEFRGIQALRAQGLGDVELHGYTHLHPDRASWVVAPDRYEDVSWYRELSPRGRATTGDRSGATPGAAEQHPLALGVAAFRRHFRTLPSTLICPGDEWTDEALERALDLGLQLVSSYYLALRHGDRFCWSQHVCTPYLDKPDAAWFEAGLPVVGYFHDYEPALEGVDWMSRWLDHWQRSGARTLMDFRELAAAVGHRLSFEEHEGAPHLAASTEGAPPLVRPLAVALRLPEGRLPTELSVRCDGRELSLEVDQLADGVGRVMLPPSKSSADRETASSM